MQNSHIVYAIKDVKVGAFGPPAIARNSPEAMRFVTNLMDRVDLFKKSPGDFLVYKVGVWDDQTGDISRSESLEYLFSVADLSATEKV